MSEEQVFFKIGHCPSCGVQTQITDTMNRVIGFMPKTALYWLCLCDEDGEIKTRVGSFVLCGTCHKGSVDPEKVFRSIVDSEFSGVSEETLPEAGMFPNKKLELIKEYGI